MAVQNTLNMENLHEQFNAKYVTNIAVTIKTIKNTYTGIPRIDHFRVIFAVKDSNENTMSLHIYVFTRILLRSNVTSVLKNSKQDRLGAYIVRDISRISQRPAIYVVEGSTVVQS